MGEFPVKLRVYLDTSVLSALGDTSAPDRQMLTRDFFARLQDFETSTSELTRREIQQTREAGRRDEMKVLLNDLNVLPITPEAEKLSRHYMNARIFPASVPEDALHVAIAVLSRQDLLVSWNFRHLVNQRRRAAIQALNLSLGLPTIQIVAPPEA